MKGLDVLLLVIGVLAGMAAGFMLGRRRPAAAAAQPALAGLGSRVEGILQLAQEQAADEIAAAHAEAERIVAEARRRSGQ